MSYYGEENREWALRKIRNAIKNRPGCMLVGPGRIDYETTSSDANHNFRDYVELAGGDVIIDTVYRHLDCSDRWRTVYSMVAYVPGFD